MTKPNESTHKDPIHQNAFAKLLPSGAYYIDVEAAVNSVQQGAYESLPYTSRILAEQLVRNCPEVEWKAGLSQIASGAQQQDFAWYPARVVCHDILGQTALVDLAGLRDAIADQGGDPARVNPVVETQLIVDHSLAVEPRW